MGRLITAAVFCVFFFGGNAFAQPTWSVNPGSYAYSMTATGVINLNYIEEVDVNNMVGAFVGGVCRGVAQPVYEASVDRYIVYLLIYSNSSSSETIDFQVYDASSGNTVPITTTMAFTGDGIIGTYVAPYMWSDPTLSSDANILTYGFAGQSSATIINGTNISVEMPAGTDLTGLVANYTASDYASVTVGATTQTSGASINDFSNSVDYKVIAADATTQQTYTIYVSIGNGIPSDMSLSTTNISENLSNLSVVASISTTDIDVGETFTYSLVTGTGDTDNSSFTISASNLVLNTNLDFETKTSYSIRLKTTDASGGSFEKEFILNITDENDEVPQWGGASIVIPENNPLQSLYSITATDADATPAFTVLSYSITSGNSGGNFAIDNSTGEVSLITSLDFETTTFFNLQISIGDGVNVGTGMLMVSITDINDETPVVVGGTVQVPETKLVGEAIYTVVSSDADAGSSLTYAITNGNTGTAFSIDAISGTIIINSALDYETVTSYSLEISASDGVNIGTGTITVNIVDANDETPLVILDTVAMSELTTLNTVIHNVIASDADAGSLLTYLFVSGNDENKFSINASTGVIKLVQLLDYEDITNYYLVVSANDGVHSNSAEIVINIIDENDEVPIVSAETILISETKNIGYSLTNVSVTDADANSVFTYSISEGNSEGNFNINAVTGEITLVLPLDYEIISDYLLGINVSDGVNNGFGYITVNVQAINDEAPVITSTTLSISESSIFLQTIYQVIASDPDGGSILEYSFISGNTNSAFQIDPAYGIITVIGKLDYETIPSYALVVQVNDGLHQTTAVIIINLINENDETPVVISDTLTLNEDLLPGSQVLQVSANDPDGISALTYILLSGNINNTFSIESSTGIVTLNNPLDFEKITQYTLMVGVNDGLATGKGEFIININDVNDEPPVLNDTTFTVNEFASIGVVVGKLFATDADANSSTTFSLQSLGGESSFAVSLDGTITVAGELDYETNKLFELIVEVSDSINSSTGVVTINVTDENEGSLSTVNVFTPNGDNINDYWEIENLHLYTECEFNIFNNLGETVYNSTGYNNDWDGTSPTGNLLPVGTYYYVVQCPNCDECQYTGFISIVR